MTDASLGPSPIAPRAIDATRPIRWSLPALDGHMIEIAVIVGGSVFMALFGLVLGNWLMLPFGG